MQLTLDLTPPIERLAFEQCIKLAERTQRGKTAANEIRRELMKLRLKEEVHGK